MKNSDIWTDEGCASLSFSKIIETTVFDLPVRAFPPGYLVLPRHWLPSTRMLDNDGWENSVIPYYAFFAEKSTQCLEKAVKDLWSRAGCHLALTYNLPYTLKTTNHGNLFMWSVAFVKKYDKREHLPSFSGFPGILQVANEVLG